MSVWSEPERADVPESLREAVGGHPLVAEVLARRGIVEVGAARAFLDPRCYAPASSFDLPDMAAACARLEQAIAQSERVCVWGDFDVDGQTATTLLVATLRDLGADVTYYIPNRERESHGVHVASLARLIDGGASLVLTCDTGVAAHEAVDYAAARGVDVVITDHHELPTRLPAAAAVVNPKRLPAVHPLRELPGVGVAHKLAEALYARAGRAGEVERLLDLVAVGIVADVAVQTGDTRYLLQRGLDALRQTERPGLLALMELAGITPTHVSEQDIGFGLGPRLNALGRLDDANKAVELLTTADIARARILASELEGLNAQRRLLSDQVFAAALAQIERDRSLLEHAALVLAHPDWPAGVIGIVASRLVERFRRPVVLIATPPGGLGRGSARSVEGCNITAAIAAHADLLAGYGGHALAAGLSIEPERVDRFRRALSRTVEGMLGGLTTDAKLQIDGYLSLSELSLDLARDLGRLAPFGPGNPPLVLATRDLSLANYRALDRAGNHLRVIVEDAEGAIQPVFWWRGDAEALPPGRFDLAYTLRASSYRGEWELQVQWLEARPLDDAIAATAVAPPVEVIDLRAAMDPFAALERLRAEGGDLQVWAEAAHTQMIGGQGRHALAAAPSLAIWTAPPSPFELSAALAQVAPERVILFGLEPGTDRLLEFLNRLSGLVQHALRAKGGRAELARLAAATAQRERTVLKGLDYLAARGDITVLGENDGVVEVARGGRVTPDARPRLETQLQQLLAETAAYRAHFASADAEALIGLALAHPVARPD